VLLLWRWSFGLVCAGNTNTTQRLSGVASTAAQKHLNSVLCCNQKMAGRYADYKNNVSIKQTGSELLHTAADRSMDDTLPRGSPERHSNQSSPVLRRSKRPRKNTGSNKQPWSPSPVLPVVKQTSSSTTSLKHIRRSQSDSQLEGREERSIDSTRDIMANTNPYMRRRGAGGVSSSTETSPVKTAFGSPNKAHESNSNNSDMLFSSQKLRVSPSKERMRLDSLIGIGSRSYLSTVEKRASNKSPKKRTKKVLSNTQMLLGNIPETLIKRKYPTTTDEKLQAYWSPNTDHNLNQEWVDKFAQDAPFFTSRAKWTSMKLMEAEDMSRGTFSPYPAAFLGATVSQQMIAEETKLAETVDADCPDLIHTSIAHILQAIYSEGEASARIRKEFRDIELIQKDQIQPKGMGAEPIVLMKHLLEVNTFSRRAQLLREEKEHEHLLLPGFADALEQLQGQRKKEQETMINTVKRYQLKVVAKIFRRWAESSKASKKAVQMLSMFLRDSHIITARQVFKEWFHVAQTCKYHREIAFEKTAKQEMDIILKELAHIRELTMSHMDKIDATMREADLLDGELEAALKKLHDPARQPPTLLKLLQGMSSALSLVGNVCLHQQASNVHEEHRVGKGTANLSHIYNRQPVKFKDDFSLPDRHDRDPLDPEIEDGILRWTPGQLKNDEYTPAFEPYKTDAGKCLVRWVNHILEKPTCPIKGMALINPALDLDDGKILAVLHRGCPAVKEGISKKQQRAASRGMTGASGGSRPGSRADDGSTIDLMELVDTYKQVPRAKVVLKEMRKLVRPPMGRYCTSEDLTGEPEPPTPEEIAAHEKRMARLKEREKECGIIVHVMSRYMGMRIHVHDQKQRIKFAVLGELLSRHPGGGLKPPPELEQRSLSHLNKATEDWHMARDDYGKLVEETPISKTDEYLMELAEKLKTAWSSSQDVCDWVSHNMVECLTDRNDWCKWRDQLTFLTWQSLCTTVLSRKVKVEEDVDDGSFTTIDPRQLMGSVFKRLKIHDNTPEQERCLAEIVKYLKSRIRDLKRIFQFYAAAEEGDANSMDHVEYWKFVRECKLQKDRRALPSVRVDLVFQAACMDWTLEGKERGESDSGELESIGWIEEMVRLASWRYPKKPPTLDARYNKMMQEEILENACSVDIDVFRERLQGDKVLSCLAKNRRNLKAIYTVYAADDDCDDAIGQMDTMNCKELTSFAKEMKLLGPIMSNRMVRTIFACKYNHCVCWLVFVVFVVGCPFFMLTFFIFFDITTVVQQEEEELEDDDDEEEGGDNEMVYSEFTEATAAMACVMKPNPYETVDSRLKNYLKWMLFPAAKNSNPKTQKVVKGEWPLKKDVK